MIHTINLLAEASPSGSWLNKLMIPLLLLLLIGGFMWSSHSSKKRQKAAQELISKIAPGDKVKTIGGVCGIVVEIDDSENTFVLETGGEFQKSYVKFDKQAIYQTEALKKPQAEQPHEVKVEETAQSEIEVQGEIDSESDGDQENKE